MATDAAKQEEGRGGALVEFSTDYGLVRLSHKIVTEFFAPLANRQEAALFMAACKGLGANPFLREIYLIKYDERSPAQIVVARDLYRRKAERSPQYGPYQAGVIVEANNMIIEREGAVVYPKETLLGGWFKGTRKDWGEASRTHRVSLAEYDRHQSLWKDKPATMIVKVAESQGLRMLYPNLFQGTVGIEEVEAEVTLEPVPVEIPDLPAESAPARTAAAPARSPPAPVFLAPPYQGSVTIAAPSSPGPPTSGAGQRRQVDLSGPASEPTPSSERLRLRGVLRQLGVDLGLTEAEFNLKLARDYGAPLERLGVPMLEKAVQDFKPKAGQQLQWQ